MFFPEAHDLLKLVYRDGQTPHHCPETLRVLFPSHADAILSRSRPLLTLYHHCFVPRRKEVHRCQIPYPLDGRWLLLALADQSAAAISRRLIKKLLPGVDPKVPWKSFDTFRMWRKTKRNPKPAQAGDDVLDMLARGEATDKVVQAKEAELWARAEDINRPFASLWTHSKLTEWWFKFLCANLTYFGVPEELGSPAEARNARARVLRKRIYFVRAEMVPNERLSRMADRAIIEDASKVLEEIVRVLPGARILYRLGLEYVFVICPPGELGGAMSDDALINWMRGLACTAEDFTTNYHWNLLAFSSRLGSFKYAYAFDKLFGGYRFSMYPELPKVIAPTSGDPEASRAVLCELCQLSQAEKSVPKSTWNDQVRTVEHLCQGCAALRDRQDDQDRQKRTALGKDYAHWEDDPDAHAAYVYVHLSMEKLWERIKTGVAEEFRLSGQPLNRHIGFSPIKEFLEDFDRFLSRLRGDVERIGLSQRGKESDVIQILQNLVCMRMEGSQGIKTLVEKFVSLVNEFFPTWRSNLPLTLSVCYGTVKYPFFEYWRDLSRSKSKAINIFKLRSASLEVDSAGWDTLASLSLENRTVSRFLHRLAELEDRTGGNRMVLDTEIIENRRLLGDAYRSFNRREVRATDILSYYKMFRASSVGEGRKENA